MTPTNSAHPSRQLRLRSGLATLIALTVLTACGSVPPAPTDHFYRLQAASTPAPPRPLPAVGPLRADSLYAERPIIYTDAAEPRLLRQYHYHLWLYPPAALVGEHMAASLGTAQDDKAARRIEGRIIAFEQRRDAQGSRAVAALELRLIDAGRRGPARTFQAERTAADTSLPAFVAAMEGALGDIYLRAIRDLPPP